MPDVRSLLLIRHGVAEERGPGWPDDSLRPLTADGTKKMRQVVQGLRALDLSIEVVMTSPLVRAAATADLIARGLAPKPQVVSCDALEPGHDPAEVAQALAAIEAAHVALVGHEPDLGELAAWLVGAKQPLPFKKGGGCQIDVSVWPPAAGSGTLVWLATPKMLRALRDD